MQQLNHVRILIIDDHPLIRAATTILLQSCNRFEVIGEAPDGVTGIEMVRKHQPDIVLSDINMHPLNGIETTKILLANNPGLTVIGFSALPHAREEQDMLNAGAVGVISKSASRQEICQKIISLWSESVNKDQSVK